MRSDRWIYCVALALLCLMGYEIHALRSGVDMLAASRAEPSQIASSRWREIDGVSRTINTYRLAGEQESEFVRRHEAVTDAMLQQLARSHDSERIQRR